MNTRTIAVANQKGGVGKTAITVNLAARLATEASRAVLVIDSDAQANATDILDAVPEPGELNLNDILTAVAGGQAGPGCAAQAIRHAGPAWPGVDVLPAERSLASRETDIAPGREFRLRTALEGVATAYNVVLIDCPPALGTLTLAALTAADQVLIVTEPRASSVAGVAELAATINTVRTYYNAQLEVAGIVLNKWRRDRHDRIAWRDELQATYGDLVIDHFLPEREVVAIAATNQVPVPHAEAGDWVNALTAVARHLTQENK